MFSVDETVLFCYRPVSLEAQLFSEDISGNVEPKQKRLYVNGVSSGAEVQLNQPKTSAEEVSVDTIKDDKNVGQPQGINYTLLGSC